MRAVELAEICSMKYGKMLPKEMSADEGFPVFSGYRITGYSKEYLYSEPMLLVVARGVGGTGDVKIAPPNSWITNLSIVLDLEESKVDKRYLCYLLNRENLKDKLNSGAAQAQITIDSLAKYQIKIPQLEQQKIIADLIVAYDDLIENNRRRIQLLEESARLLYQEWFVHLRFPGHEQVKIVDGVPEGWEKMPLKQVVTLNYGKALKAEVRIPGPFPVYGSSGEVGNHEKALVKGPGIVVGRKGNVGSVYWVNTDFYPIDTVYFISAEESNLFLYHALQNVQFINTDVAVPGLNRDMAYSREILIPDDKNYSRFLAEIQPIQDQINKLQDYNNKLAQARDLLLPKLMSGELTV